MGWDTIIWRSANAPEGDCSDEAPTAGRGIRQVLMGGPNFNMDYPCHSPGRQRWFRLSVTPLRRDRRAGAVVMHIDVTERKLAEQKLEEIVQIQREISVALESLPDLLELIVERAQKLTGSDGAAMAAVEGDEIVYQASSGVLADTSGLRLKRDASLSGLGAAGSVLYCADTEADSRVDLAACRILGVRSMIVAPLRVDTEIIGVLKVISRKPNGFGENDVSNISLLVGTLSGIIHRRQIEDRLHESEKQYRLLFQNNPLPMMAYDLETLRFVAVNEAAVLQLGYSAEEFLSMSLLDIRPPEDRDRLLQMMTALGRGNYSGVWRHLRKNGTILDVEVHSDTVVFDGHSARLALTNDVTERLRSEREVARTSRALQLLSICNEAVIHAENEAKLLDQVCHIVVQTGGYRMAWVGYAEDDESKTVKPAAHAGEESGYLSENKISWSENDLRGLGPAGKAIRTGKAAVCHDIFEDSSMQFMRSAAERRGFRSIICLPLRDEARTFGILGLYAGEVTASNIAELGLLQEMADNLAFGIEHVRAVKRIMRQATLLDAASDAIILRGIGNEILYWNKGAERIYGWQAKQVLGEDAREIYVSERESFDKHVRSLMEKGTWAGELAMHSRDGREIIADSRWTLLRDENGNPEAILSIVSDITERKKLENQLLRVQRLESLGTLAGGVAHDLNNVLAPILMGAGILKNEVVSDLGQQLLASMEASAKRGADLVRQVLSFARGVEGKRIPVNVVHILNEISNVIHDAFPKNIEFIYLPSRDLWTVLADPTQLHQVFTNLCVNARDAMPNGGTLKVITENTVLDEVYAGMNPEAKPGAYVVVKVDDTGTGIPPAIREKIFEPFFTTKEIGKGTGLGLSTTIGIVKSHAGFINLYSEMGKGTIFKVYLPADTTAAAAENTAIQQSELPRGDGQLVLLVDDESTIRSVAQKTLERYGYRVLLASNGAEAIACYAKSPEQIAVVITDMAMPVMDGPATIVALKALNPEVKIIGSSGIPTNGGVAKAVGAGVKYFVPKPYTAESMLVTLAKALNDPV